MSTEHTNVATENLEEKIARAIFAADGTDTDWRWQESRWDRKLPGDDHARYRRLARAVIEAVRT